MTCPFFDDTYTCGKPGGCTCVKETTVTTPDEQTVERVAEIIYNAMAFLREDKAGGWVPKGNSLAQDHARQAAHKAIAAMPDTKALEAEARENIVDEIEGIICETHEMDVRDVDYAENIVSWLERHHPAALHAIDATYRTARGGKA